MASRVAKRSSLTLSYVLGGVPVVLGLPIFWGYIAAIFPLVIGLAIPCVLVDGRASWSFLNTGAAENLDPVPPSGREDGSVRS